MNVIAVVCIDKHDDWIGVVFGIGRPGVDRINPSQTRCTVASHAAVNYVSAHGSSDFWSLICAAVVHDKYGRHVGKVVQDQRQ